MQRGPIVLFPIQLHTYTHSEDITSIAINNDGSGIYFTSIPGFTIIRFHQRLPRKLSTSANTIIRVLEDDKLLCSNGIIYDPATDQRRP
jgi:hypothetical protein